MFSLASGRLVVFLAIIILSRTTDGGSGGGIRDGDSSGDATESEGITKACVGDKSRGGLMSDEIFRFNNSIRGTTFFFRAGGTAQ